LRVQIALLLLFLAGCVSNSDTSQQNAYLASSENPIKSPSGKYTLQLETIFFEGTKSYRLGIKENESGTQVFTAGELFRVRDTNFFLWDSKDRVWAYNGDTGTYLYFEENGVWKRVSYSYELKDEVPEKLVELRPKMFK
jgi:hypothetical protein